MPEAFAAGIENEKQPFCPIPNQLSRNPFELTMEAPVDELNRPQDQSVSVQEFVPQTAEQKLLRMKLTPEGIRRLGAFVFGHTKILWACAYLQADSEVGRLNEASLATGGSVIAMGSMLVAYSLKRRVKRPVAKKAKATELPIANKGLELPDPVEDSTERAA